MTPEALVARAMLAAVNNRIAFIEFKSDCGKLSGIRRAKYGIKPIFVAFGADNAPNDYR